MNINNFVWQFNGKKEPLNEQTPMVSMYVLPFKKEWLLNGNGNPNVNIEGLINKYFGLNIAETTLFQVFFRNNDNTQTDFLIEDDSDDVSCDNRLCHYFYGDSIYAILKNYRIIQGKRVFCDDYLMSRSSIDVYSQIADIRYLLEGGYVLPSSAERFLVFFENSFNFEDIALIYWRYLDNYYQLKKHRTSTVYDWIASRQPHL